MGLETLGQTFATTGIMPGYMAGEKHGADLASTIARTRQQGLESARYEQATPMELEKMGLANETSRLGNLEGQYGEQYGVQEGKAKLSAAQNKQLFDAIPREMMEKAQAQSRKAVAESSQIIIETIHRGGSIQEAIDAQLQHITAYSQGLPPEQLQAEQQKVIAAKKQALAKYGDTPEGRQKFVADVTMHSNRIASAASTADPKTQHDLQVKDLDHQNAMELAGVNNTAGLARQRVANQGSLAAAGVRGAGSMSTAEIKLDMIKQHIAAVKEGNTALANELLFTINSFNDNAQPATPSPLGAGFPGKPGNMQQGYSLDKKTGDKEADGSTYIAADGASSNKPSKQPPKDIPKATVPRKLTDLDMVKAEHKRTLQSIETAIQSIGKKTNPTKQELDTLNRLISEASKIRANLGL